MKNKNDQLTGKCHKCRKHKTLFEYYGAAYPGYAQPIYRMCHECYNIEYESDQAINRRRDEVLYGHNYRCDS